MKLYFLSMILPWASRSIRSMGWITSARTFTTSPALMLDGTRMRTFPMSDMGLASAAADGDLHLALGLEEGSVALLHDRAHVAGLAEPDVGPHVGLAGLRRERHPGHDRDPVLVADHVDVLDVVGGRHGGGDLDRDRHHRPVLGDERDVELDEAAAVLDRPPPEHPLHGGLDA